MKYGDLRDFMAGLERQGELRRVAEPVSPVLEMTALERPRVARCRPGPAVRAPDGTRRPGAGQPLWYAAPCGAGHGAEQVSELQGIGELLARLKEPEPPGTSREAGKLLDMVRAVWDMKPKLVRCALPAGVH